MVWVIVAAALLAAGYAFLVMPNPRRRFRPGQGELRRAFAHRGLHGSGAPENSLTAFRRAARKGYGIELDVRQTGDRELVILHDPDLARMCGEEGKIADLTVSQIQAHKLLGTGETVPTLDQALEAVAPWAPPLIVEMKSARGCEESLPSLLLEKMKAYPGFWCVESFDPRMVRWFRKHAPHVIRGQLAFDAKRAGDTMAKGWYALGGYLLMNFLSRPDFVAYRHDTDGNLSFRMVRRLFRPALAAWTVKTIQDFERLRASYDLLIFEGFEPYTNNEKESIT